jgi:hypothetical protein
MFDNFYLSILLSAALAHAAHGPVFFSLALMAGAPRPIKDVPQKAATPINGQITTIGSEHSKPIGNILPVDVSIANGSNSPLEFLASQIFVLADADNHIAPLPPAEAARQAGGVGELRAALPIARTVSAVEGALGAGLGAVAGSLNQRRSTGAGLAVAIGGGLGAIGGGTAGPAIADEQANTQLNAFSLPLQDVRRDFTISGLGLLPQGRPLHKW